jgi:hypothetical protein
MVLRHKIAPRGDFEEEVVTTIKDFLHDGGFAPHEWKALTELAAEAMSTLIWRHGEQMDIEEVFEACKENTLRNLKQRFDHWQAKVSAVEAQSETSS